MRGSGLGTRLLETCTGWCDAEGLLRIVLSSTVRSVPLHTRAGFAPATDLMLRTPPG